MASSYTTEAFVVHGSWSAESRKHPAMRYIESAAIDFFDTREHSGHVDYHTKTYSLITPKGEHFREGTAHTFENGVGKVYMDPLTEQYHEPYTTLVTESEAGYAMYMQAHFYANVKGTPVEGERKVKDSRGKEWDVMVPIFYEFELVKDPGAPIEGIRMNHSTIIKDQGTVQDILDKRGVKRG